MSHGKQKIEKLLLAIPADNLAFQKQTQLGFVHPNPFISAFKMTVSSKVLKVQPNYTWKLYNTVC